ncbi:hypothetical protein [Bacillus mobilis]|uniref:hypothetical protein n=3 Tax=Bacillus TaxID=1386 RepID=UPI0039F0AA53
MKYMKGKGDTMRNLEITELEIYTEHGKLVEIFVSYQFIVSRNDVENEIYILLDQGKPKILRYGDNGFEEIVISRRIMNYILKKAHEKHKKVRLQSLLQDHYPSKPPVLTYFHQLITKETALFLKEEAKKEFLHQTTTTIDIILFIRDYPGLELTTKYIQSKKEDCFVISLYEPVYCDFRKMKYHVVGREKYVDRIQFYVEYLGQNRGDTHTNIKVLSIQ